MATIAGNNDPTIGNVLADAFLKVGKDGVITIEEGKSAETTVEVVEGMQFDRGFLSPHFVTNPDKMVVELENCYILIYEEKISSNKNLIPLLEAISKANKPLLIVAEDVDGEALATLVVNKLRGILNVCAVKAPGYGDRRKAMLGDIAVLTNAKPIFKDLGIELESVKLTDLGRAKRVRITSDETVIVGGAGTKDAIDGRANQIRHEIEQTDSDYDREKLQERLAKLAGGVAQIHCGAATETEMKERKSLLEDARAATQAALEEGIVPGGGVALLRSEKVIDKLESDRRRSDGCQHRSPRARISVAGHRGERRFRRGRGRESRPSHEGQERRLRRRERRILRPARSRHRRSGQGRPHRVAERGQRGQLAADHFRAGHRNSQRDRSARPRRSARHMAAWVAWAAWEAWVAWAAWVACQA